MTQLDEGQDPARDLLVLLDYTRGPDGATVRTPIGLDQAAAQFAAMLMEGRATEGKLDRDYSGPDIGLSAARARVAGTLLEELAVRLEPGRATGPIQSDGSLSDVALGLASYLRAGY